MRSTIQTTSLVLFALILSFVGASAQCPPGASPFVYPNNTTTCQCQSNDNFYDSNSNVCLICPQNAITNPNDPEQCVPCANSGQRILLPNNTFSCQCPGSNEVYNASNNTCQICPQGTSPDQFGQTCVPINNAVPTLSQWGLIILGLTVMCLAAIALVRRQRMATR